MDRTVLNNLLFGLLMTAVTTAGCEQGDTGGNNAAGLIASNDQSEALVDLFTPEQSASTPDNEIQEVEPKEEALETTSEETLPVEDAEEENFRLENELEETTESLDEVDESTTAEEDLNVPFLQLSDDGDVVNFVEIDRYMGRWYEIATTPSFQQAACFGTTADYIFNEEMGWVDVTNGCYSGSLEGNLQQIKGRAEIADEDTQAKLFVIFFGQSAPYWVVALDGAKGDQPYQWAVVSVPGGQTMWLLSRTKTIDPLVRETIEAHLTDRGFDVSRLIDTSHAD